jgi:hypothetical protein
MPTTLDKAAEQIAPTRATTDYFNPAAGQSVMSRYANAGRRVADSELAAEAGSRLLASRTDRLTRKREQVQFDRDEEDYREKQDFKVQRGDFLRQIASISPEAEDFEDQIAQLYTTLPEAALKDDAVVDMLHSARASATDLRNERQAQARRDEEQANRVALIKERYARDPRLNSLSPEEREQFYGPDGEFDSVGAAQLAYQKARQDKKTDAVEVAKAKMDLKVESTPDRDLDDDLRALKTLAKEHTQGDPVAFPSQVEAIRASKDQRDKLKGKKDKALEDAIKKEPDYEKARKYDSNRFVSELESARNMTEAEYVDAAGKDLAANLKEKRRVVWKAANPGGQQAPAPATPAAPATGDKFVVGKRYRDGQGREKTYKGDGQWE